MDTKDSEFLKRIQATFRIEAKEHIKSFSEDLIELEKSQTKENYAKIIETLFREIHSLKGAARSVGQKEIESVCQPLENLFSSLKRNEITLNPTMFDLFHKTAENLSKLVLAGELEQAPVERHTLRELIQQLKQLTPEVNINGTKEEPMQQSEIKSVEVETSSDVIRATEPAIDVHTISRPASTEVVRIQISKLDPLLLQAEEFLQTQITFNQQTDELIQILNEVVEWKTDTMNWRGRRSTATVFQWNEWQDKNEFHLNNLENHLTEVTRFMEKERFSLDRLVTDHLDAMKQALMLPVSSLVEVFPAMVREISREQQKEIEFIIRGTELEIDKRILEELKDPLIHLIRNSIDHGIGTPKERVQQNKPPRGTITMAFAAKENGLVEISVSDDGKGIDKDKVLKAALKSEIISPAGAEKLNKDEILSLIFQSGVSTSQIITDLSGRGLGLSIVSEKVEKLNGRLSMETKENIGTTFRILLPMSMAAFRGIVVSQGEFAFILPTMNVERVMRVMPEELKPVENHETIRLGEDIISVVNLAEVLGLPGRRKEVSRSQSTDAQSSGHLCIVVLVEGENRMAFKVGEVLDEQQVLVKGLGKLLKRVRNISGVTILGSGKIVPVLHIADLMKSAVHMAGRIMETHDEEKTATKSGKILVAEDSITSRTLLKNILETAGYQVITAVDGAEAFTRAKSEVFDLIVSDVDMPRLNGFELTVKIKSDKKLSEIPVVLVTALESREDRERGIEAGADAYIIKSRFDQGNLLEVIKKLI
jgi:two-component system chemotaxis sensor kinase CheA